MRRLACLLTVLLPVAGCTSVTASTEARPPVITISPKPDETTANPDRGLTVRVRNGTLTSVSAFAAQQPVVGSYNPAHTIWTSDWTLIPATVYVVNATATGAGGLVTRTAARFRTLRPSHPPGAVVISPRPKETVGVGMPIIVDFGTPIVDRVAVERALEVRTDTPVEGAWRWFSPTQVVYRPRTFWAPRQRVVFTAHLAGIRLAPGTYGTADRTVEFTIGRKMVSTVDTITHRMVVRRHGRIVQRMAISAGKATTREYTTTSGVHLTMDKGNPVRMLSPGRMPGEPGYYDLLINYAVRISNSGEYVHALNNLWAQGRRNVSHGCVNARPDQAAWFYTNALRGDPVVITGTERTLEPENGWGYWQLPWAEWRKGSALSGAAPYY
ncbi:L,D-transpeptidase [Acrocarpospora catenulata]|uniref:L,D-transpeptidase n=1 Tax=Acrocarpospora catenulata TaxID=2836182 RepID=UPI001BD94943|nr:Ig-like domain-containing protein [Acrocarpospora catenulata]